MLEVVSEDFIRTAKAKGLSPSRIILRHAFRNALIPIITVIGLMFGSIITGAVLTESIFSWPGVGRWLVKSVEARDYPVIQGGILYMAMMVIFVNLVVDMLCIWAQPKLRGS
jgi:dipeptide transport system permease protein